MSRSYQFKRQLTTCFGIAAFAAVSCFGQAKATINIDGTEYSVTTSRNKAMGFGPAQQTDSGTVAASDLANAPRGLPFYTTNYRSFGTSNPFNIVGTDPSLGAATTTIPTVIVPIRVIFPNGFVLDGTNQVAATQNSPIFLTADYTTGGTDIGVTQFGDAIQRAQFWNLPGFSAAGYHVLLGAPTIAPTVSIIVPSGSGNTYGQGFLGLVDPDFFDAAIDAIISSFTPDVLPIFLTDNVFESPNGLLQNCCILGYHSSEGPPIATAHTWIYAAYVRAGTFTGDVFRDVQGLSHEVAEWINDPFVGAIPGINFIPPAILPGQDQAIFNFEVGDPLEAPPVIFTKVTNGKTYQLQDEVFLPWYTHEPSFSVRGFYTFLGTFISASKLAGPG